MINLDDLEPIEDESEEITALANLFNDLDLDEPSDEHLYKMYGIFLNDFVKNPIYVNGVKLIFNTNKSKNPICRNKYQCFEHCITRESKSGKRVFDRDRANKIHWIKIIIENYRDYRIKYFEKINDEGYNQLYYWYEEENFLIILREISPDVLLITSFSVDGTYTSRLQEDYDKYMA